MPTAVSGGKGSRGVRVMGLSWWSRSEAASCELYVDKVVKFISGLLQLLLGLAIVILTHGQ